MHFSKTTWPAMGVVAVVALVAAACGSSTAAKTTPSPSATQAAAAQVKSDWQRFFAGTTPAAQKIALLQNGQQFAKTIQAQAASPIGQGVQAQVTSVKILSPTKAAVTYTILIAGKPVLKNATGQAVLQNGSWKVGAASFQGLLALEQQSGGASGASGASASPGA